jgi:Spy/CpxP family protein refolding chaperone
VSKNQAVAAALLAGLLAGTWLGFAADRRAHRGRGKGPNVERIVKKLARDLKLDEKQSAAVREAMTARRAKHEELRKEHEARFKALRAEIDADIEKVLTPEQKKAFAEKRAEWERKRAR